MQQEFQKHIEQQLREEKLSELENSLQEPVILPSVLDIFQQKLSDKRQSAYQNLKLVDQNSLLAMNFPHKVPQEIAFQQVYLFSQKKLENISGSPDFDPGKNFDINLFTPVRYIGMKDMVMWLQKEVDRGRQYKNYANKQLERIYNYY